MELVPRVYGRNTTTRENKVIQLERVAWNCVQFFSRDGENEMMRNASYFMILFFESNYLHFIKEASKSSPLLVQ